MSKLERLIASVPDVLSFVRDLYGAPVEYPPGTQKTVQEHVKDQMADIEARALFFGLF